MLRQRGDNDRQAIAHHEGSQRPSDKCSDRESVDEIGRLSGNGRCNALPHANAHPDLSLFARHQSPACGVRLGACGVWPNTGRTGDVRANRHHDGVESMTRDATRCH